MVRASADPLVLLTGVRTPFARAGGVLGRTPADDLARAVFREVLARSGIDPADLDHVILGCAGQPAGSQNLARVAAMRAGVPQAVPAFTVHRNCASGMEALAQASLLQQAGEGDLFLVGGVESMSLAPLLFPEETGRWLMRLARARTLGARLKVLMGFRLRLFRPRVGLVEGLTDPVTGLIMGKTAEVLAREFGVSREEQDAFALESHRRAAAARKDGVFLEESMSMLALPEGGLVTEDDGIREDLELSRLARMRPYFDRHGTVTIGNACQVTDGAAAFVVCSVERARSLGLQGMALLHDHVFVGLDPRRMGLGPVYATSRLLERSGRHLTDYDCVELNEAFAVQVLACQRAFESQDFARKELGRTTPLGTLDPTTLNPHGGAIALGHPVGATGLRLVLTLAHELRRRGGGRGLATLCIGGGQGAAFDVEVPS